MSDEDAWRHLVDLYGPLVHRWCKRSGLNDEDVADIFQETFRSVSTGLRKFRPTRSVGSFRSWLRAIVRTKIVDHFRGQSRRPVAQGGTDAQLKLANLSDPLENPLWESLWMEDEASDGNADDDNADDGNAIVVQNAMKTIKSEFSRRNWSAFWQVAVEGKTAADVARAQNCSPQAVRQANYRIRRRLRLILRDLID